MFAEYKHTLRRLRGNIIGWGIGMFLYALMMGGLYSSMKDLGDQYMQLLKSYPPEFMAFFPSIQDFTSPIGYIDTYFSSYMPIILAIFAIGSCAKLLVGDEEKGILDLVGAHPISRASLYWSRFLGFVTATLIIMVISWLGWVIPAENAGFTLTPVDFALPFLPLLAELMLFGAFALFLSMLMPSARLASGLTGALLVGNFLLIGMSGLNEKLLPIYEVSPLYFHQGAKAIEGVNWGWLGGLFGVSLVLTLMAWWLFERRDIRVGGEAGWKLPVPAFFKK